MKTLKQRIEQKIDKLWKTTCNNASEAHFRAQELTRLQNKLSKL